MKKNVVDLKDFELRRPSEKRPQESPKNAFESNNVKKFEKKGTIKNYNEFVKMIIKEETKEKIYDPITNHEDQITPIKEKNTKKMQKTQSKLIPTVLDKNFSDENPIKPRKIFTPKSNKFTNENQFLVERSKNLKANLFPPTRKETFNITPNITPIKEVMLPEKKILVRSFSKGNLIQPTKAANNQLNKKNEKNANGSSAFTQIQNIIPKPKKSVVEKEFHEPQINPTWNLTEDEKNVYGDRILENYIKLDLLGKGGFALVWLGEDKKDNDRHVAIKQIAKMNSESCKKELFFGQLFFNEKGEPRDEFIHYNGINYITHLLNYKSTAKDLWMVFELGGHTLSKLLYEMKGEFFKGERVYQIKYSKLFEKLHTDVSLLQKFIQEVSEALILLSDYKIVHSDLKPDNILMELSKTTDNFEKLKLIDFGSAYSFEEAGSISMATPEYMPPEVLELIINANKYTGPHKTQIEALSEVSNPWSVDVWSLASIILEILIGVPHWISYKCKVTSKKGKDLLKTGLFAVKGRTYDKIIAKQKNLIENLENKLAECLDMKEASNRKLSDLLMKMFEWNPKKRISPHEIVKHPFLSKNI